MVAVRLLNVELNLARAPNASSKSHVVNTMKISLLFKYPNAVADLSASVTSLSAKLLMIVIAKRDSSLKCENKPTLVVQSQHAFQTMPQQQQRRKRQQQAQLQHQQPQAQQA
jgi:hypothetical protein